MSSIIAIFIFFISFIQGDFLSSATFLDYAPYNFNRHLSHFQRKNYNFWHELYRNNYDPQPFLRYSQPGFISSGPLNKVHTLDSALLTTGFNGNENLQNNNAWSGANDVYGYGLRYPSGQAQDGIPTSSVIPPTKRTTRPRTTYTTRERTTVSLSTDEITRPTTPMEGSGNEVSVTTEAPIISPTTASPKPSKSPSQLLAQIAQINNSSNSILGQLGKPTRKPGSSGSSGNTSGGRPSASSLLQQIQKVNSSAQHLLVTLKPKPNTKYLGYEITDQNIWTTARTTESDSDDEKTTVATSTTTTTAEKTENNMNNTEIMSRNNNEMKSEIEATTEFDTTTLIETTETPNNDESSEKMVLISTSNSTETEEGPESRDDDLDLPGTTQENKVEETTDPIQEDLDELDNRHEEYELEGSETLSPMEEMMEMDDKNTTINDDASDEREIATTVKGDDQTVNVTPPEKIIEAENRIDDITTTESPKQDDDEVEVFSVLPEIVQETTLTEDPDMPEEFTTVGTPDTTTLEPEEESSVDQELIEFIVIDIITTTSALQSLINSIVNPFSSSLGLEFTILQSLLSSARDSGITNEETAEKIGMQIVKITSNIGLKRLRSTQILELTQRLNKLGKLLKLSVSNF